MLQTFMVLWSGWQIHGRKSKEGCLRGSSYLCLNKLQEAGAVLWVNIYFLPLCSRQSGTGQWQSWWYGRDQAWYSCSFYSCVWKSISLLWLRILLWFWGEKLYLNTNSTFEKKKTFMKTDAFFIANYNIDSCWMIGEEIMAKLWKANAELYRYLFKRVLSNVLLSYTSKMSAFKVACVPILDLPRYLDELGIHFLLKFSRSWHLLWPSGNPCLNVCVRCCVCKLESYYLGHL